jgi:protein-S-isoprenylcysteine O-methyltransferase Ste14
VSRHCSADPPRDIAGSDVKWTAGTLIAALWIGWLLFWIVTAIGTKKTETAETTGSHLSHFAPLVLGAALLVSPRLTPAALNGRFIPPSFVLSSIAAALVVFGLALAITARIWLAGNWSRVVTIKQGHELIASGPYGLVRHPIYTGLLIAVAGSALAIGQWRALCGLAIITAALLRKLSIEERLLLEHFGEGYAQYREKVPALIPFIL